MKISFYSFIVIFIVSHPVVPLNFFCKNDTNTLDKNLWLSVFKRLTIRNKSTDLELNFPNESWPHKIYNLEAEFSSFKLHIEADRVKIILLSKATDGEILCKIRENVINIRESPNVHLKLPCRGYFDIVVKLVDYKNNGIRACRLQVEGRNGTCPCPVRRYCNVFNDVGDACSNVGHAKFCHQNRDERPNTPFLSIAMCGIILFIGCMVVFMIYLKLMKRRNKREPVLPKDPKDFLQQSYLDLQQYCKLPSEPITYQEFYL